MRNFTDESTDIKHESGRRICVLDALAVFSEEYGRHAIVTHEMVLRLRNGLFRYLPRTSAGLTLEAPLNPIPAGFIPEMENDAGEYLIGLLDRIADAVRVHAASLDNYYRRWTLPLRATCPATNCNANMLTRRSTLSLHVLPFEGIQSAVTAYFESQHIQCTECLYASACACALGIQPEVVFMDLNMETGDVHLDEHVVFPGVCGSLIQRKSDPSEFIFRQRADTIIV